MFAGGVNAHVGHSLALRSSGDHAFGMHVADIAAWRDRERVTFADGGERWRLEGRAGHLVPNPRDRTRTSYDCTATPIAPDAWTHDQPVKLWAVDDGVPRSRPWSEQVFHPTTTLSDDCAAAVHEAYAYKKADKELIKQYRFMQRIFGAARRRLTGCSDLAEKRQVLRTLGEAALAEHAEWTLMHRERRLEHSRL